MKQVAALSEGKGVLGEIITCMHHYVEHLYLPSYYVLMLHAHEQAHTHSLTHTVTDL